jgi:predicted NBD/HSP70 family sugar kinase
VPIEQGGPHQGSNSVSIRQFNVRVILSALRRLGSASKADIARQAALTTNAAGVIVRELERAGLVREQGKKRGGGRGQPATMLTLDPEGAYAVGIRIDRGAIETVLVDFAGRPIARRCHIMDLPSPEETIALLARDVETVLSTIEPERRTHVVGIGVAAPYNLGSWMRELGISASALGRWDAFDIAAALVTATGYDVIVENDGTAAAVAELFYGHGRTLDDFLYLFIGPAIGGGVVLAGQYLRGVSGNAGDVAMIPVQPSALSSAPRPEKVWDILISRASINALVRHLRWSGAELSGLADLSSVAARHSMAVEEWTDDCADALVVPVLASVAVLDVASVVIDSDLDRTILDRIIGQLQRRLDDSVPEARNPPRILRGSFGKDAGAVGAASLPLHLNFSPHSGIPTGRRDVPAGESGWPAAQSQFAIHRPEFSLSNRDRRRSDEILVG